MAFASLSGPSAFHEKAGMSQECFSLSVFCAECDEHAASKS
jgi:hypothetical protein